MKIRAVVVLDDEVKGLSSFDDHSRAYLWCEGFAAGIHVYCKNTCTYIEESYYVLPSGGDVEALVSPRHVEVVKAALAEYEKT